MAFLDWIRNRNTHQQKTVAQKPQEHRPENAKQWHTREAALQKASEKPIDQIRQADKTAANAVGERMDKATQHLQAPRPTQPAPSDGASNPEPMRQNMMKQDDAAPALTPTSAQAGIPATDKEASSPSKEVAAKTPETPARAPQTLPRPRPSWER